MSGLAAQRPIMASRLAIELISEIALILGAIGRGLGGGLYDRIGCDATKRGAIVSVRSRSNSARATGTTVASSLSDRQPDQ
jgi:hypothetical protein